MHDGKERIKLVGRYQMLMAIYLAAYPDATVTRRVHRQQQRQPLCGLKNTTAVE
jgi:hypothetical protein